MTHDSDLAKAWNEAVYRTGNDKLAYWKASLSNLDEPSKPDPYAATEYRTSGNSHQRKPLSKSRYPLGYSSSNDNVDDDEGNIFLRKISGPKIKLQSEPRTVLDNTLDTFDNGDDYLSSRIKRLDRLSTLR